MKAIFFKKILLFASISILLFSCEDESENSEDESENSEPTQSETITVKQFEIVPLTFESGDLMHDEYDATLGDATLVLSRHDDTTLVMSVPNVEPGTYNLTIDELGTYQNSFNVELTELTSEPVTVVEGVSEEMLSFANALPEDDPDKAQLINYFNEFSDYINSADADQQQEIALFYEANREIIDTILYGDTGNNTKCFYCVTTVNKHRVAVLAMSGGVLAAKYAPTPEQKLAGALVALVAFKSAKDYALDILAKRMRILDVAIEDLNSKSNTLNFIDGEEKEFTMQTQNRGLLDSDRSLGFDDLSIFFYAFDKLNSAINTLNTVITFVNDNVFFIDMDLVPNIEIEPLSTELYDLQSETYSNYSFSIDHPNVTINQEFLSGSSILLTMNVDEDFTFDEPIETQLLVGYVDGFNDLEVTYDVVITSTISADFTVSSNAISSGETVDFTDLSTGDPDSWDWDFGDGSTSTQSNPSHTYSSAGTYTVELTVSNDYGSDTETKTDYITVESGGTGGTVTDIDGNVYNTVVIGDQEWMAENLKTTTYNDGTSIDLVTDNTAWENNTTGAYCWYDNDQAQYAETYGALYNWYAVNTGNLCPDGWHVPTDEEWTALEDYIASDVPSGSEGAALKATYGWNDNGNGTDDYGFSALPGGYRDFMGSFFMEGGGGYWWSSTEVGSSNALGRHLDYYYSSVFRYNTSKEVGFSIRCLRD